MTTMTYKHWRDVPESTWRWKNFSPAEIACRGTGSLRINEEALDKLQALRDRLGKPLIVRSAYRSPAHNRAVGGAPRSKHMDGTAFDIAMANHDPVAFEAAARAVGFLLAEEVAIEFAEQEGAAFAHGDGINKPRGILAYDTVANASHAWGKIGFVASGKADGFVAATASANPADCLIDLYYALKSGYRNGASWLMSDATMNTVRKFKDAEGAYVWAPPSGPAQVATILGKPVHTDDNMPAVAANAFPVAFGDFGRAYLIVDRIGIRVLRDPYTAKPNVLFYTTKRVGGGVVNFEALKLLKVST
ncbi:HK97 family phage major capsid protein [Ochrobactrum sp. J50]|nr:HK97 family phage major capsid protein [Ochrobactrum sp. J50]